MYTMFDNEAFIIEVSNEESIWNIESKLYHDKVAKHVSWTKIAKKFFENFETIDENEKKTKIQELQKKWKSFRDSYRRKCVTKSGQAKEKQNKYVYGKILEFLRPTMQNRVTESNIEGSESDGSDGELEDHGTGGSTKVMDENNISEVLENSDCEIQKTVKSKKRKKTTSLKSSPSFGENLLSILENRQRVPDDPEKSFLMSLLPQIKTLTEDQKTQLYVEFLNSIQRVKRTSYNPTTAHLQTISNNSYTNYSRDLHNPSPHFEYSSSTTSPDSQIHQPNMLYNYNNYASSSTSTPPDGSYGPRSF